MKPRSILEDLGRCVERPREYACNQPSSSAPEAQRSTAGDTMVTYGWTSGWDMPSLLKLGAETESGARTRMQERSDMPKELLLSGPNPAQRMRGCQQLVSS
jgi:hypothetical protein